MDEDTMGQRLMQARKRAGFTSASAAAKHFGWRVATYLAHENGQNRFKEPTAIEYGEAFNVSPAWLMFGGRPGVYRATTPSGQVVPDVIIDALTNLLLKRRGGLRVDFNAAREAVYRAIEGFLSTHQVDPAQRERDMYALESTLLEALLEAHGKHPLLPPPSDAQDDE
jgi:hypothetical protein